jgi:hypothetical protein
MDVQAGIFTQGELCQVTGLDTVTVDTWLLRGVLRTAKVGGRTLRRRRLFSVLGIFEAAVSSELVTHLAMGPTEAAKVARCASTDWAKPDDWKPRIISAVDRSAKVTSVFLLVARKGTDWRTKPVYGSKTPWFTPESEYEKWTTATFAVLPASDLLASVYKECVKLAADENRNGADDAS